MDQSHREEPEGALACAQNADAGAPSGGAGPGRRNSARRKLAAVTRLLRGEPVETVARELNVTAARLSKWRRGLRDFIAYYNATWLVARHGYRTPNQIRAEQRGLAQCSSANLPLAA